MKKYISAIMMVLFSFAAMQAQTSTIDGTCGDDMKWSFDGNTLTITTKDGVNKPMNNYNTKKKISPWREKKLNVKKVLIGKGVTSIGSCAFAGCENLTEVLFEGNGTKLSTIGWGAFLNCTNLRSISLPVKLTLIEKIAFANCRSLSSVKIPAQCRVEDQAFASCDNLTSIDCASTAVLGQSVFAKEEIVNGKMQHTMYSGTILHLPPYINTDNCNIFGISREAIEKIESKAVALDFDPNQPTSIIDSDIPVSDISRNNTYVLIIGNEKYRFVSDVPYAIHDAHVFSDYCQKVLGVPSSNIHLTENATKHMILEEELDDWITTIKNREEKRLIIYYAGHGVPDTKNNNKSYLLPTDVRGGNPKRGIPLDEFYAKVGEMNFEQTAIFLDACFSGLEGMRSAVIAEDTPLSEGNLIVFSAAQGNETAQGYPEQGHGLFTYYLLNELREKVGNINFGTLSDNIKKNVSKTANDLNLRSKQTPSTNSSEKLKEGWRYLTF